jgi:hypothetical protein
MDKVRKPNISVNSVKVKLSLSLIKHCAMKMCGGVKVLLHTSLTLALLGEPSASHPNHFTPEERTLSIHYIGGLVDHRAGVDAVKKRSISFHAKNQTPVP